MFTRTKTELAWKIATCVSTWHSRQRNCRLPDHAMARERPKASPVQGEVAKIFDFCRRGCCRSKLPLCRNLCEFEAFSTQSLSQLRCQPPAGGPVAALTVHRTVIHSRDCASLTLYTREPWRSRASASSSGLYGVTIPSTPQWCCDNCKPSWRIARGGIPTNNNFSVCWNRSTSL